jgi:hypothetical protein
VTLNFNKFRCFGAQFLRGFLDRLTFYCILQNAVKAEFYDLLDFTYRAKKTDTSCQSEVRGQRSDDFNQPIVNSFLSDLGYIGLEAKTSSTALDSPLN